MGQTEDFFQAVHGPAGADAGFSLGYWNHGGGFGTEVERIKEQDVFIGIRRGKEIQCFPFFQEAESAQIQTFVKKEGEEQLHRLTVFSLENVTREFGYGSDLFCGGRCLFPDNGWKLSANSINSWMSKIFLCEYVAENILQIQHPYEKCDKAHADWWRKGCPSNPGIDQIMDGTQEETGFHYPRCVTSTLWW